MDQNRQELSIKQKNKIDANFFYLLQNIKRKLVSNNQNRLCFPQFKMAQYLSQSSLTRTQQKICLKHKKSLSILVVNRQKYICEDCAIFDNQYKQEIFIQKEQIRCQVQKISSQLQELIKKQKDISVIVQKKMNEVIRCIEYKQSKLINQINNQFMVIKTQISQFYISSLDKLRRQKQVKKQKKQIMQIYRQRNIQHKINKHYHSKLLVQLFNQSLNQQIQTINLFSQNIQQSIENQLIIKIPLYEAFQPIMSTYKYQSIFKSNQSKKLIPNIQQENQYNLLDFSQFNIQHENNLCEQQDNTKRSKVQRMKTAPCLQDSLCQSIESLTKSIQNSSIFNNIPSIPVINYQQNVSNDQFLLTDRSFSCSSIVSKKQQTKSINTNTIKQSKKSTIQINSLQQYQTKFNTISPAIKTIKLSNIPISNTEFMTVFKQKISSSFINTLEIYNCNKLNDKILIQLKNFRCKTLKKITIKQSKQFNWNDKKVQQIIKKLQADGVKILF